MSILNRIFGDNDDNNVEKAISLDFLVEMNDEELDAEFRMLSAHFTRLKENAGLIVKEMLDRGTSLPIDTALFDAIRKNEETPTTEDQNDDNLGINTEDNVEMVQFEGPKKAKVAFIGASLSNLDRIRDKLFTGPVGKTMREVYLPAIGAEKSEVAYLNLVPRYLEDDRGNPREPTEQEITEYKVNFEATIDHIEPEYVIALGKTAANTLESWGILDAWVPHPRAINIYGDSGEVGRKLSKFKAKVQKLSDPEPEFPNEPSGQTTLTEDDISGKKVGILKTDDEQQVVLGVVIEPEELDTDENWTTAEEIEKAAHDFMVRSQTVGIEHVMETNKAAIVESFISPVDFELNGETVKKGSWIVGVKVFDDTMWQMVKSGDFTGFSFGGTAAINPSKQLNDV